MTTSFWGITLGKGDRYKEKFENDCYVTTIALEHGFKIGEDEKMSVEFQYNNTDFLLCDLSSSLEMFETYDLSFKQGEEVIFSHNGKGNVFLTGCQIVRDNYCFKRNLDFMLSNFKALNKNEIVEEKKDVSGSKKRKKRLMDKKSKKQRVKITDKDEAEDEYDREVSSLSNGKGGASKTSSKAINGVTIDDIIVGDGQEAKKGKTVQVYYTGKFANRKIFDSINGVPYSFRLGQNSVIRGLNVGVEGMKVGGKRKLIIPPKMGYGSTVVGRIPANSTLYYEVELASIS